MTNVAAISAGEGGQQQPRHWLAPLALLGLTLLLFGDLLFGSGNTVVSHPKSDTATQFLNWYRFGFSELRQGHLALWNPHLFSGAPYFGNFESALLYPPNWLFTVLTPERACTWLAAFHVFLVGAFTYYWLHHHVKRPLPAFLGAVLVMFGGPYFSHVSAGHLTNLAALCWAPLVLLAVDQLLETKGANRIRLLRWWWVGTFAVAMQILAGHPQSAFRTGFAALLYCLLRLVAARGPWRAPLAVLALFGGALALSAVQVLAGLDMVRESTRASGALSYDFAAMFPLPPENFLTYITPNLFGNEMEYAYWGRSIWCESNCFMGVVGLVLALWGGALALRQRQWVVPVMAVAMLVVALGVNTPLYYWLYTYVPGFSKFRVSAEFIFQAGLFLALLAAQAYARLGESPRLRRAVAGTAVLIGLLSLAAAYATHTAAATGADGPLGRLLTLYARSGEVNLDLTKYHDDAFIRSAGAWAARGLLQAALGGLALTALLALRGRYRGAYVGIALLAVIEMGWFTTDHRDTFDSNTLRQPALEQLLATTPGDYRVLDLPAPNLAMGLKGYDIWGYDPVQLRRYAEFVTFTQGGRLDQAALQNPIQRQHRWMAMLRLAYIVAPTPSGPQIAVVDGALPQVLLVQNYQVVAGRDAAFAAMSRPDFEPVHTVILETEPVPRPVPSALEGRARVTAATSDTLTIEAETASPALLLVTDTYSDGWQAVGLSGSAQSAYTVLPANYALRAIPLEAGKHHLQLVYVPRHFRLGARISLASLIIFGLVGIGLALRRRPAAGGRY